MRFLDAIRRATLKTFDLIRNQNRQGGFVCADCERFERCGLPPSETCVVRAEQIARNAGSRWLGRTAPIVGIEVLRAEDDRYGQVARSRR